MEQQLGDLLQALQIQPVPQVWKISKKIYVGLLIMYSPLRPAMDSFQERKHKNFQVESDPFFGHL